MNRKCGFTLAEILVTLGIIGVVAALTAPALVNNTRNAQIGPTLANVKTTIENANKAIIYEEGVDSLADLLTSAGSYNMNNKYQEYLLKQVRGSASIAMNDNSFDSKWTTYDGTDYSGFAARLSQICGNMFVFSDSITLYIWSGTGVYGARGGFGGSLLYVYVDINGAKVKPNTIGKDIFTFILDRNGTLVPMGSSTLAWLLGNEDYSYDNDGSTYACNSSKVGLGTGCAGSIFDNDLKVIYQ